MNDWIANGVAPAWLINPYDRQVVVYKPGTGTLTVTDCPADPSLAALRAQTDGQPRGYS
jgi:Uma2 family endonuclease